jgi:hypothetical protein
MPQGAKNGDFRNQFPILTHNFPAKCMDFEPPNTITLHLIVSKMPERIVWQRFYTYSASPKQDLLRIKVKSAIASKSNDFD